MGLGDLERRVVLNWWCYGGALLFGGNDSTKNDETIRLDRANSGKSLIRVGVLGSAGLDGPIFTASCKPLIVVSWWERKMQV